MADNGINNPKGVVMVGAGALYAVAIPITSYLTASNGTLQSLIDQAMNLAGVQSARKIAALCAFHMTFTYLLSALGSAAGQAMGSSSGMDSKHPRSKFGSLKGTPLRLLSAHQNMMETFAGFALAAALTQYLAPADAQLVNLLSLYVVAKGPVYWTGYVLGVSPVRSVSHLVATSSAINVLWRLALG